MHFLLRLLLDNFWCHFRWELFFQCIFWFIVFIRRLLTFFWLLLFLTSMCFPIKKDVAFWTANIVCHLRRGPYILISLRTLIHNKYWIYQISSQNLWKSYMIFLFWFINMVNYINNSLILNHPCILKIYPIWSLCLFFQCTAKFCLLGFQLIWDQSVVSLLYSISVRIWRQCYGSL